MTGAVSSQRVTEEHEGLLITVGHRKVGPKGMAVRHLKWYASWVQNVVRQFGPYLPRA